MRASVALACSDLSVRLLQLSADRAMLADVRTLHCFLVAEQSLGIKLNAAQDSLR